jgi:hypothetical protein
VLDDEGRGETFGVAKGIRYAREQGARVINLSLGLYHHSDIIGRELEEVASADVAVAGAAGNDGTDSVQVYPALDWNELKLRLRESVVDIYQLPPNEPFTGELGTGRIDGYQLLVHSEIVAVADDSDPSGERVLRVWPNPAPSGTTVRVSGQGIGEGTADPAAWVYDAAGRGAGSDRDRSHRPLIASRSYERPLADRGVRSRPRQANQIVPSSPQAKAAKKFVSAETFQRSAPPKAATETMTSRIR